MATGLGSPTTENYAIERLLDREAAARLLGVTSRTLDAWFKRGMGPPRVTIGAKKVRYRLSSLSGWISSREVSAEGRSEHLARPSRTAARGRRSV